jgi:hypothetical protein
VGWRRYAVVEPPAGDRVGRLRGTLQVVTYTTPGGMCFPAPSAADGACARAEQAGGVEFVRYSGDDADARFHQVIARRKADGRTVVVIAAGPSDAGSAAGGAVRSGAGQDAAEQDAGEQNAAERNAAERNAAEQGAAEQGAAEREAAERAAGDAGAEPPPLSAAQVTDLATDPALPDAFGADEWCDRIDPGCPELRVPLVDDQQ